MKVVYHELYKQVYASDPAADPGRIESVLEVLDAKYQFVRPKPATESDLRRVHTQFHIESVKRDGRLYEIACLAAGGAIKAAELAMEGEPGFGLLRPPGHHASPDHCWGFCFFNNVAIALAKLQEDGLVKRALILDFDLHFGDGTDSYFRGSSTKYFQPGFSERGAFVSEIERVFEVEEGYDVLAVSAGFDRHIADWGGQLSTDDYRVIGRLVKEAAEKNCQGRRFAVLEGGYNHDVLGTNVEAFLKGMG
ncbi:MAG: histone deacetylase family protein [Chloroflexi bacterium]|nr:histone deacetylase family protein [Chloroflexota bacterium]MBM3166928.1 histone deacetylase family protein [Chloroflexota bacterium]MBM4453241.1 histone deacetylase family protein [Chloroflexota bacterium]